MGAFRKYSKGDRIRSLPSQLLNGMVDVVNAYREGKLGGRTSRVPSQPYILVRNDTGADIDRASVLGLDGPIFTPLDSLDSFVNSVAFSGITPTTADHRGKFCVTLDPALSGMLARAYLVGVCPVQVDVTDVGHQWADVTDGDYTQLTSGYDGQAKILWKEADDVYYGYTTGTQWALVRLGEVQSTSDWFKLTSGLSGATTTGGTWTPKSSTANRVRWNGSSWTTIESSVTIWTGNEKTIASNSYVYCTIGNDGRWWVVTPDACAHLS